MTTFLEIKALESAAIDSITVMTDSIGEPYCLILKAKDGSRFEINPEMGQHATVHVLSISHFVAPNSPDRLSGVLARVNAKPKLTRVK